METRRVQVMLVALVGGGLAAGLVALRDFVAPLFAVDAPRWTGPLLAGLGGLAASLVTWMLWRRQTQQMLARLTELVGRLRRQTSTSQQQQLHQRFPDPELERLSEELERLGAAYRTALSQLVAVQEKLDRFHLTLGRSESDQDDRPASLLATHFVVGSSRHRMVARLAPNLNVLSLTQPLSRLIGRRLQDQLVWSFLDVIHSEDAAIFRAAVREALRDGESHNVTLRLLGPHTETGEERYVQLDILTAFDDDHRPLHLRCHFQDVTARVLAEREKTIANAKLRQTVQDLERLKESYFDLYHFAPVLYFSLDAQGNFLACNATLLQTLGYSREQLLGKPYHLLLTPQGKEEYLKDPSRLRQPGEFESRWVKSDGTIIDVWIGTTVRPDASGAFLRSRSAARDISETKRLGRELQRKAEEVGRANEQLRRINQELEEFTYVISHDLKEPLRSLEAFSKFLVTDYADVLKGDGEEYLTYLRQASQRMGRLIDDLLTLSRTGRVIHTPRPFAWPPVIATVLNDLRDLIQRKNAIVRVEEPLPAVVGDPERLMQLLANLISNALKYNQAEAPEVVIGWRASSAQNDRGMVTLFVRDNGIGIAPAHHEQIFRIFHRLHHRDEIEGTGAGLAICKRIVEAHGGRIWVESQLGQGATFLFTLREHPNQAETSSAWSMTSKRQELATP